MTDGTTTTGDDACVVNNTVMINGTLARAHHACVVVSQGNDQQNECDDVLQLELR